MVKAPKPPAPPAPPITPGPPLPINTPFLAPTPSVARRQRSLYEDLFGTDLSVITMALDAPWANHDMRRFAAEIMSGRTSINRLSTAQLEMLDGIARAYNDGGNRAPVRQKVVQRLPTPKDDESGPEEPGDDDREGDDGDSAGVRPDGGSGVQGAGSDWDPSRAYSWTEGGEEG